jgi:hypothetical protein
MQGVAQEATRRCRGARACGPPPSPRLNGRSCRRKHGVWSSSPRPPTCLRSQNGLSRCAHCSPRGRRRALEARTFAASQVSAGQDGAASARAQVLPPLPVAAGGACLVSLACCADRSRVRAGEPAAPHAAVGGAECASPPPPPLARRCLTASRAAQIDPSPMATGDKRGPPPPEYRGGQVPSTPPVSPMPPAVAEPMHA